MLQTEQVRVFAIGKVVLAENEIEIGAGHVRGSLLDVGGEGRSHAAQDERFTEVATHGVIGAYHEAIGDIPSGGLPAAQRREDFRVAP